MLSPEFLLLLCDPAYRAVISKVNVKWRQNVCIESEATYTCIIQFIDLGTVYIQMSYCIFSRAISLFKCYVI